MQTKFTNRPVEQAVAAIRTLDLEPIRLRVMDSELGKGWTCERAENIEHAYRDYLTMLVKHPDDAEDIVVSKDVDEFWHAHILHTMKYTEDCEKVFGKYLHHNPHVGERTQADVEKKAALAEKTRRLYQQELGNTAFCSAAVRVENPAFCSAAVQVGSPAFCSAAVMAEQAAFCSASILVKKAAFCSAAVQAGSPAFCSAAVKAEQAAFCSASILDKKAAFCSAAVKADSSAFCSASARD